ncbi:MAG: flagellar hook-basal body protein [Candidatus Omnitrophota bacterium]
MITGLYSAASGMIVQEKVQDQIAQNLAGCQMPGFRREEVVIRSFPDVMLNETYRGIPKSLEKARYNHAIGRVGTGAGVDWSYIDHSPGQTLYTDNPSDMAINGDGFFTVLTPDGLRYTRAGDFVVDKDGYLKTHQGYFVMGQGINNQRNPTTIYVGNNDFYVDPYGQVFRREKDMTLPAAQRVTREVLIDQLKITDFEDKDKLFREPGNYFRCEEDDRDNMKVPAYYRVEQGYIEKANCFPTTEMVKMIDSYRVYEASARVLKALDGTLQKAVNEVAR